MIKKITAIFLMILVIFSFICSVSVSASFTDNYFTIEEARELSDEIAEAIRNELGLEPGEVPPPANEINDWLDGCPGGYIVNEKNTSKESLDYCKNFLNELFSDDLYAEGLKENNYSNRSKASAIDFWYACRITYGEGPGLYPCDGNCVNKVECIVKEHIKYGVCQDSAGICGLLYACAGIPVVFEESYNHLVSYDLNYLVNEGHRLDQTVSNIWFVSGNVLYSITIDVNGDFTLEKEYVTSHECQFNIFVKRQEPNCAYEGYEIYRCSVGDEKADCYCLNTQKISVPKSEHTFNNKIVNDTFYAGETSVLQEIDDKFGEIIDGKMTYTNVDGTTVSTTSYGGYHENETNFNIWGYENTDQVGSRLTSNFHDCEVAKVVRYSCDRTATADDFRCENVYKYEIVEPEPVTYTDEVIQPTCENIGYIIRTCNNCGKSKKVNKSTIDATGCNFENGEEVITKYPTCSANGSGYRVCVNTGCENKEYFSITERPKHKLYIFIDGYSDIDKIENNTCLDSLIYGYVYCGTCNKMILPEKIDKSEYPEIYEDYEGICNFRTDGSVEITIKANGKHDFAETTLEQTIGNKVIVSQFCYACNTWIKVSEKEISIKEDSKNDNPPINIDDNNSNSNPSNNNDKDNNPFGNDDKNDNDSHESHEIIVTSKSATYFETGYKNRKICAVCGKVVSKGIIVNKKTLRVPKIGYTAMSGKKIKVKYYKVSGATGFQVRYKARGSKKWTYKNFSTNKAKTIYLKKLKAGKKYNVQVRAFAKSGKSNVYSNWSKVKTIKIKK